MSVKTTVTKKRSLRQRIAEKIWRPNRTREAFDRMRQDAGFIPIFNVDDLEARRQEIRKILDEVKTKVFNPDASGAVQREIVQKTFALFFSEGDPWYRGIDNRELAEKVSLFLANCTDCGYLDPFLPDLFEEAIQLLHLSYTAIDVTVTPPYIIESRPILAPAQRAQVNVGEVEEIEGYVEAENSEDTSQDST
ncbi:MAG: hypothetical protein QXZ70_01060 [Candidatus Bathyarchaeia archaeon]